MIKYNYQNVRGYIWNKPFIKMPLAIKKYYKNNNLSFPIHNTNNNSSHNISNNIKLLGVHLKILHVLICDLLCSK